MRVRTLFALVAALAMLFAAMPRDAHADEGWTIERFAAQIAIQRDGSLLITESIDVDFGALVKHGIYREIPIEYTVPGDDKHNRIYGFEAVSVTDAAGKPVRLSDYKGKVIVLDFWATWCGPCRSIGPIVEELAESFSGRVKVTKLNVDENPATPGQYGVRGIPTLILFKGGKILDQIVGAVPKRMLTERVTKHLN